ncbi:peptidase [Solitalea longa]|uniref:Peptidase n=1 Tax=Solitalea longa TaxID=2079460 RepID=A0A2S4ZZC9_9SPHI|nr:M1 family metallopeptidase [Solitalea longa]POY35357.1 peptidase [Solitalea longa]
MKFYKVCLLGILALAAYNANSQALYQTVNIKSAFEKGTRAVNGKPGANYWQNRADYKIKMNFDPQTKVLSGEESITYFNNSPDALSRLIIRLYPDFYKKGVERNTQIDPKDENEGVVIDFLKINEEQISDIQNNKKAARYGTNLMLTPSTSVAAKSENTLVIKWHYTVNTGSQQRTGAIDESSFFIAYSFPRLSVYDDINGWDMWSYKGTQEFYNDFGNYEVEVTAPKNFIVWATGDLQNGAENLNATVTERLKLAATTNKTVHVIDSTDYKKNNVFAANPTGSWKFKATNVSDFAFALSDHYLWDASSVLADSVTKRRVMVNTAYNKIHQDYFEVQDIANKSVELMSHVYPKVPFPYPQITIVDGTDQMEYPMMVNDNPSPNRKYAVQLTTHEIFHTYFPFYMGINETQYAWMDEGWASIGETVLSALLGEPEDDGIYSKTRYEKISGSDSDMPLIANTKNYDGSAYVTNSYGKGALSYHVLRDMLGDKLFFKALHQYMNDWNGKHPTPYDYFNSFNNTTGKNLNWFWRPWFFEWVYPDLSVNNVSLDTKGQTSIVIENKGGLPLPIHLVIKLENGKEVIKHFTAESWAAGNTEFIAKGYFEAKVKSVTIGDEFTPDKQRENNKWEQGQTVKTGSFK